MPSKANVPNLIDGKTLTNDKGVLKLKSDSIQINGARCKVGAGVTVADGITSPISNDNLQNNSFSINGETKELGSNVGTLGDHLKAFCFTSDARDGRLNNGAQYWMNWEKISDPHDLITISNTQWSLNVINPINNMIIIKNTGLYLLEINWIHHELPTQSTAYIPINYAVTINPSDAQPANFLSFINIPAQYVNHQQAFLSQSGGVDQGQLRGINGDHAYSDSFRKVRLYIDVQSTINPTHKLDITTGTEVAKGNRFSLSASPVGNTFKTWEGVGLIEITRLGDT
jgi:hypothetical protein